MISPTTYELIRCAICGRDRFGHRRDNGECHAFERASVKPYALYLRRVPASAAGWKFR